MRFTAKCFARGVACLTLVFVTLWSCLSLTATAPDEGDVAGAREYVINSLYAMSEEINIEGFNINKSELLTVYTEILKNNPYLFFVGTSVGYRADLDGKILSLYPNYTMTAEKYEAARLFCERQISSALTLTVYLDVEAEKAQYIHDWLCLNFSYDESLSCDNMYLFLKEGRGTCQGYTYTYMEMLRAVGIECSFAASDSMAHIWNIVKIEGEWYHVDVTWDDYPEIFASLEYASFLKSDTGIKETAHIDWYSPNDILCVSEKYSDVDFACPFLPFAGTGDVNCDGVADVLDLVLCELDRDKLPVNTGFLNIAVDMDGDCALTDADRLLIRKRILD